MGRVRFKTDENYIAFSDIMTCLMIIFLFIAISYIMEVFSATFVKDEMYNRISSHMLHEVRENNIALGKDMSLKFFNNETGTQDILFETGKVEMTDSFKAKVTRIWPVYQSIITNDEYFDFIGEIRIEGHTDTIPPKSFSNSSYEYNLNLSSARAQEVLKFIRRLPCYLQLDESKRQRLQFLMTANGMSFSRALNDSNEISYLSQDKRINAEKSRRVEFRIVTTNQRLIESLTKK